MKPMSDIIQTNGSPEENIVLFEVSSHGIKRNSHQHPTELATKSVQALGRSMAMIQALANRTTEAINKLPHKPQELELEFGIKIDADLGALVSKGDGDDNLRIKMVWKD